MATRRNLAPAPTPALLAALALLATALTPAAARAQAPAIDGLLSDWASIPTIATDPAGDANGPIDLTAVRLTSAGTRLFAQLDLVTPLNLSSGPSTDPTLRMIISLAGRSLTIDFRGRRAFLDNDPSQVVTWPAIDFVAMPTTASTRFELRIDTAAIGATQGSTVRVAFDGADSLATPADFALAAPPAANTRRSVARPTCNVLRVASLNTSNNFTTNVTGLNDLARQPAFRRLIDAVNADVYCFSEEYSSTAAQVRTLINSADPLDNATTFNVIKSGELVVASPFPMTRVTPFAAAHLAVIVSPPAASGKPETLVITTHLKCCGFIGNSDDNTRISQSTLAAADFVAFRNATLSTTFAAKAGIPAILIGDMNLVGSTTPMDRWTASAPAGPGLTNLPLRRIASDDAWTWKSASGLGFWPGALDASAVDTTRSIVVAAFSLDSSELTTSELQTLALQASDSDVSDHAMSIVDLAPAPCPCNAADIANTDGDLPSTPDGALDNGDFTAFFSAFFLPATNPLRTAADIANTDGQTIADGGGPDGQVDNGDFSAFFAAFFSGCRS
ncbi:MAG: GC-type dockerin domain-anchored protein [Phycisphaerales bacterium]|jgi:hypothetical protein|nr:hypothetical protein [Phycisphaeraceae bacterium]